MLRIPPSSVEDLRNEDVQKIANLAVELYGEKPKPGKYYYNTDLTFALDLENGYWLIRRFKNYVVQSLVPGSSAKPRVVQYYFYEPPSECNMRGFLKRLTRKEVDEMQRKLPNRQIKDVV